jgi:2-C-methyl-D-erythritol 4-phosphate cytidylyltransferase
MTNNTIPMPKAAAIVAAAGTGSRFKGDKIFTNLKDMPVIVWTLKALESAIMVTEIVPVVREDGVERLKELIKRHSITKVKDVVVGGAARQDSVYNGLKALSGDVDIVLIHDGARPLIRTEMIGASIESLIMSEVEGVVVGVPVKDTVKRIDVDSQHLIKETLDRGSLWLAQTPQVFYRQRLIEAFKKAYSEGYYATDDAALMEYYGAPVMMLKGSYENIKITTPEDLLVAMAFIAKRDEGETAKHAQDELAAFGSYSP